MAVNDILLQIGRPVIFRHSRYFALRGQREQCEQVKYKNGEPGSRTPRFVFGCGKGADKRGAIPRR